MSYEHCELHDCDATNGCPQCARDLVDPPKMTKEEFYERWRPATAISLHAKLAEDLKAMVQHERSLYYRLDTDPFRLQIAAHILAGLVGVDMDQRRKLEAQVGAAEPVNLSELAMLLADQLMAQPPKGRPGNSAAGGGVV